MKSTLILFALILTVALASCEKEDLPNHMDQFIGEWQMWFLLDGGDTLYSPYFYAFYQDGTGQEELTEYWIEPLTWEATEDQLTITWQNGTSKNYNYHMAGHWLTLYYKTYVIEYRYVSYIR